MTDEPLEYQQVALNYPDQTTLFAEVDCPTHGPEVHVFYSLPALVIQLSETIALNGAMLSMVGNDPLFAAKLDGQIEIVQMLLDTQESMAATFTAQKEGLDALSEVKDIGDIWSN